MFPLLIASFASAADIHDQTKVVLAGHGLGALPMDTVGVVGAYGADVGVEWASGNELTLRLSYLDNPPPSALLGDAAWAAGPLMGWKHHFYAGDRFDISVGVAGGLLAGPEVRTGRNMVVPSIQVNGGARVMVGNLDRAPMFVEAEVCAVVTLLAPCAAVGVGVLIPTGG